MLLDIERELPYDTLCKIAGDVLLTYMDKTSLEEGVFYAHNQKIILATECSLLGTYDSCIIKYMETPIIKTRYTDYPWSLKC